MAWNGGRPGLHGICGLDVERWAAAKYTASTVPANLKKRLCRMMAEYGYTIFFGDRAIIK
jgi:hypothetical protein